MKTIICIHGPQGSGKTLISNAISKQLGNIGIKVEKIDEVFHSKDVDKYLKASLAPVVIICTQNSEIAKRPDVTNVIHCHSVLKF